MIYRKVIKDPFLRYHLVTEADDNVPKNRKVIRFKAQDKRKETFSRAMNKQLEEENITSSGEEETSPEPARDTADDTEEMEPTGDEPSIDNSELGEGETSEEEPARDTARDTADDTEEMEPTGDEPSIDNSELGDEDDTTGEEGETGEEPTEDTGDDGSEPSFDNDELGGEENEDNDSGEDSGNDGNNSSNDESNYAEQSRKYKLYQKFIRLDSTLGQQADIINNLTSDNVSSNQKYKQIAKNIKELKQLLSEYLILRFKDAAYVRSMLFYQRVLAAADINLSALSEIKKNIAKNTGRKSKQ